MTWSGLYNEQSGWICGRKENLGVKRLKLEMTLSHESRETDAEGLSRSASGRVRLHEGRAKNKER